MQLHAYLCYNGQADEGRAVVHEGHGKGLSVGDLWNEESNQAGAHFGVSVGTAGDVNGDGYDDVIVGAHQYDNGAQTSSVLPLAFGLVPDDHVKPVFEKLVNKIMVETDGHIGTGLIGGQWLNRVLSDNGRPDVAYTLASQKTYPSWGYMIEQGATTIWELWNGDTADPAMNSRNHVMLVGDLGIWFYEYVAGIRPDPEHPGFERFIRCMPISLKLS